MDDLIIRAKGKIGLYEGAKAWITERGIIRVHSCFKTDKIVYSLEVVKGVVIVKDEKGKQIEPKPKKRTRKLSDTTDEATDRGTQSE